MILLFDKLLKAPWSGRPSIYSYIREQGESVDGALPDDEDYWAGSKIRWVAGGLDGAFGHHASPSENTEDIHELIQLLVKHSRKPKSSTRKKLYSRLISSDIIGKIDAVLEEVRKHPGMQPQTLFDEATWMVERAAHRNVVKFGIALLGLFRNEQVKELLLTIGRHEEFTLYAAVAIHNGMEDSNEVLFELAKHVRGWGKIHIVERLEPSRPQIKDWLLRHGCQNSVMNEYLACICARNGNLRGALSVDRIDEELFAGATDLIQALINGGPAEDIDDYEDAPQVITDYVRLADEMSVTAKHLSVLLSIRDFLETNEGDRWTKRLSSGWTEELRAGSLEACQVIIARPDWKSVVMNAVESGNMMERYYGVACARELGLDVWDQLFAQLAADPMQDSLYFELMKSDNRNRIRKLVQFAEKHLPLQDIATGPAEEMGFGPEYAPHRCLDFLLQSLDKHEGVGGELILAGLRSPVIRNRNMALMALEGWAVSSWGNRVVEEVVHLSEIEPDDSVKERIQNLRVAKGI